jgi:hypothetical protein
VALLAPRAEAPPVASGLVVRFDRFPAADARLRAAWRSGGAPVVEGAAEAVRYPWSRLALRGSKAKGGYAMELLLDPVGRRGHRGAPAGAMP